ncbi:MULTISPECIES: Holliday junction resolvase RuvX [Bacillales]|jgi:putative Holliday junction resolvase|uniref:Putative pre-16S rRNA nuclease n=1 Tax=Brevibacillus aydinogluensis TaxID=927786 RepID=A0AA48MD17_9BACL|nr:MULTISPECIES: Holliday junction resolvase RuvX [Bacillales]REK64567.1 MAG: Holliday junction resolvase RuvX [Brevibacillus sp.]MBR8659394.1 Holliday junction resolvase RuvX [Brevibacillus sp. NL20B1]MDT3414441.1 putative Holliday junction resolvase [Brevibacillus aydinogluensis]NNV02546.1 Holliday junction resolvase RuvX [Brevibacillus sp. MCWH]UFJ60026.1 Holliday junction resolvase RuvX [Anoxybacillus sediminis]
MARILGLDVGEKTIGVAVSDELGWTAQGVETIRRQSKEKDLARLKEWIQYYQVGEIVVGLPKNMNGTIGARGESCQAFARWLEERTGLPVRLWDERLTTMAAERMLITADVSRQKRKNVIDKMAATLILQGYLDAKSR